MPAGKVNLTDPDSRLMKTPRGYVQGYNVQAVVERAADRARRRDHAQLGRLLAARADGRAAQRELEQAGVSDKPEIALADAGYWNEQHMDEVDRRTGHPGADPARLRQARRHRARLDRRAIRVHAHTCSRATSAASYTENARQMVEPVFAHTKHNRQINRFHRRGRSAVRTEWRY